MSKSNIQNVLSVWIQPGEYLKEGLYPIEIRHDIAMSKGVI